MAGIPLVPADTAELAAAIREAGAAAQPLEVRAGGSKAGIGTPGREVRRLDVQRFAGIIDYDPAELVLTVGAATPLTAVEALLARQAQRLAFEPFDHGAMLGRAPAATIGGIVAAGVAGPRRLSAGGARDHLLGFEAVSGRGEPFVAGGRVVKNVTGYDLSKLMAGSWGRLAVLTRVTVRVVPRPRTEATLLLGGLDAARAVAAMAAALGSPAEVSAAAHLPGEATALRLEGIAPSVEARAAMLRARLAAFGIPERIDGEASRDLWRRVALAKPLAGASRLWRLVVPPTAGPAIAAAAERAGADWLFDWAGGLVWLGFPDAAPGCSPRALAAAAGGHAMLVRAPGALRRACAALQPEAPGVAALSDRVKAAFDPLGILDPQRWEPRHAN